jgi:Domain of unknown function (DUF5659)
MKNEMKEDGYHTTDLYFAAYLQVAGAPMQKHARQGSRVSFVFSCDIVNIEELRTAWFNKSGKVSALEYANTIKNLKHLCHMP